MSERLYYNNSYLFEFDAMVTSVNELSDHFDITLEKTAFYPESGGQSSDCGRLDGQELIEVMENDSGDIIHRVKNWSVSEGGTARGEVDRIRRLDNMRKHTGQHILSAAFLTVAQAETVSAHLGGGGSESTIELATSGLDEVIIHEAELLANEVIMENQSVEIGYYTRDELKGMTVRKIPDREGKLRIVQIGRFDITACGGTHCRATGELGPLKIIGSEKIRGRFRISFLSGRAAVEDYHEKDRVLGNLTKRLTCHYRNLDDSIGNLVSRNSELKKEITTLQRKLLPHDIERLIGNGFEINGIKIVVDTIDKREAGDLRRLVIGISQSCRAIVAISNGDNISIGISSKIDYKASKLAEKIKEKFGGRGGGSQSYAQVGGLDKISAGKVAEYLVKIVKDEIK